LHLRDLDRRIGAILGRADWRAAGVSVLAGAIAAAGGAGVAGARFAAGFGPVLLALLSLGTFSVLYLALTLALRHPDAARLWKLVT
ncbi:MAG TPA: hypothetical protein VE966_02420, partial [Gemmatimonadales bacterium]|nr:hypothetical protein [Gemmatimonadales bacterium]